MSVLGSEQLLLQHVSIVDQGKAVIQHRQFAQPTLDLADFALQSHQLGRAAALFIL